MEVLEDKIRQLQMQVEKLQEQNLSLKSRYNSALQEIKILEEELEILEGMHE